jgi:hypothetical protein
MRKHVFYGWCLLGLAVFSLAAYLLLGNPAQAARLTTPLLRTSQHPAQVHARPSQLVRIGQFECWHWWLEYVSHAECERWGPSDCSTTSMTEVANYYGRHLRIHDILVVEEQLGEITPEQGLLESAGIARTMAAFGFQTRYGYLLSLDQVIATANGGRPVIVDWPPFRYDGGHLLVVVGGDRQYIYLADSSRYNRQRLTHWQFLQWWAGFSAVVTPR